LRFVIVSVLLLITLVRHGFGRRNPRTLVRLQATLLLFLVIAAFGSFSSVSLGESVPGHLASAVTLAVPAVAATSRWRDRATLLGDLSLIYRYLLLIAAIGLGFAAAAGFSGRAAGIHANPNTYAFMCVLAFGLDLGLRTMLPRPVRLVVTPALVLGVVGLGQPWRAPRRHAATAYLVLRRSSRSSGRRVALILLSGGAILLAFPVAGPLDVRTVYERTFGEDEIDLSGRQLAWENMLRLSAERPVFGHGLRVTGTLLGQRFATGPSTPRGGGHSGYLTVLVETGWVRNGGPLLGGGRRAPRKTSTARGRGAVGGCFWDRRCRTRPHDGGVLRARHRQPVPHRLLVGRHRRGAAVDLAEPTGTGTSLT
jgi:O-antigen ligase